MEPFFRYISYIDLYNNNNKIKNAGFLRWKCQLDKHSIEIHVKDADRCYGYFEIEEKKSKKKIGNIKLDQGIGNYTKDFFSMELSGESYWNIEDGQISINRIEGFHIPLSMESYLYVPIHLPIIKKDSDEKAVKINIEPEIESASQNILIEGIEEKYIPEKNNIEVKEDNIKILEPLHEDKWQQLKKKYPIVHPFSNSIVFLSIQPEDFIILQKTYQKLVNNSFLLHGFYNYGHLILGKLVEEDNAPLYIGVPGVYYDGEKQAAQMFGFVGFESAQQPVQAGSYGYYMIEVMI